MDTIPLSVLFSSFHTFPDSLASYFTEQTVNEKQPSSSSYPDLPALLLWSPCSHLYSGRFKVNLPLSSILSSLLKDTPCKHPISLSASFISSSLLHHSPRYIKLASSIFEEIFLYPHSFAFVCSGCCRNVKCHALGGINSVINNRHLFLPVLESGKSKSKVSANPVGCALKLHTNVYNIYYWC